MKPAKKIEIVIESLQEPKVMRLLKELDFCGYTVLRDVGGLGTHGQHDAGHAFTDALTNSYIITVCSQEKAKQLASQIKPLLAKFGGICFMSDVSVVKTD